MFGRWRKGIDLDSLIELLQSEKLSERQRGAWYLDEASPPKDRIADIVIKPADDPISDCRWRFVAYVTSSGLYSDAIADRLAACLLDLDLYVRAETIFWAVWADDETFDHFVGTVLSGAGTKPYKFRNPETTAFGGSRSASVPRGVSKSLGAFAQENRLRAFARACRRKIVTVSINWPFLIMQ